MFSIYDLPALQAQRGPDDPPTGVPDDPTKPATPGPPDDPFAGVLGRYYTSALEVLTPEERAARDPRLVSFAPGGDFASVTSVYDQGGVPVLRRDLPRPVDTSAAQVAHLAPFQEALLARAREAGQGRVDAARQRFQDGLRTHLLTSLGADIGQIVSGVPMARPDYRPDVLAARAEAQTLAAEERGRAGVAGAQAAYERERELLRGRLAHQDRLRQWQSDQYESDAASLAQYGEAVDAADVIRSENATAEARARGEALDLARGLQTDDRMEQNRAHARRLAEQREARQREALALQRRREARLAAGGGRSGGGRSRASGDPTLGVEPPEAISLRIRELERVFEQGRRSRIPSQREAAEKARDEIRDLRVDLRESEQAYGRESGGWVAGALADPQSRLRSQMDHSIQTALDMPDGPQRRALVQRTLDIIEGVSDEQTRELMMTYYLDALGF